ncbi:Hpt domain-containing protein [Butyrivibrio sp. VCB2006]|uniref:Hpt domain-containing protein n=1 Tax=Butyrivibrio sp. VCB2006 TaxID=1280679 RepID=UPI0003F7A813|nr:Hpt domain-containing protein [Butyrivibrio sp. VCB2006]
MNINIPGVDVDSAINNSGSEELFTELLGDVYKIIDEKSNQVEAFLRDKDIKNYTILVHSLKTTCRMVGAMELGESFFTLEKLGKENDLEQIEKATPEVLSAFRALKPYLEPFAAGNGGPKAAFDKDAVSAILNKLISAIDDFDLGSAEEAARSLFSYSYNQDLAHKMEALDKLVTNLDYVEAKDLAGQILGSL